MGEVITLDWAEAVREKRPRFVLAVASAEEREEIYGIRHEVYARELGQHAPNTDERLTDGLDGENVYLVVRCEGRLAGFVSLTPPGARSYSVEKYFARKDVPIAFDERLFEIRLLTVRKAFRGTPVTLLLMYAALRWVEAHAGAQIMAIGRREVAELYERAGLQRLGMTTRCGAVTYDLMHARVENVRERIREFAAVLERLQESTEWQLSFPWRKPAACFHGGAFFGAIGERFDRLECHREVINADVLDAWFPPSPNVMAALQEHLPWLLRTSPPTACEGLIQTIAEARGVGVENILPGAGSSDLIFRAFTHWLKPESRTLILDPTYGEYAHVLERVIGCQVDRFELRREEDYEPDLAKLGSAVAEAYDAVVLVNPNSPTGRHVPRAALEELLRNVPLQTRVWLDETYVEYAGEGESLERFATRSENVIVCKSMSKAYALSGARVAYLCAGPNQLEALRALTPPWVVGLPTQVAAVKALEDAAYYRTRYSETRGLREELSAGLQHLSWEVLPGIANFVLCHLPAGGPSAADVVRECRKHNLFLRDAAGMGAQLGTHTLRIAVKDRCTNERMLSILASVCGKANQDRKRACEPLDAV